MPLQSHLIIPNSDRVPRHKFSYLVYVKTHRRHFRQQSRYTISAKFDMRDGWQFVPHDDVFDLNRTDQDVGWKIIVPTSEREKVMRILDRVNINEFSLFESEEGLMETLAVQEIDLRRRP